nr:MAG: major capsid protein [Microvirus sp.]
MRTQVGAQTKTVDIPRASFDLSHGLKTTLNASELVPILSLEILPGDTINLRAALFGRMATPQKPLLENLFLETFFFFTPWRQVYPDFIKLMGEQEAPGDSIDFVIPNLSSATPVAELSIGDYYGLPLGLVPDSVKVSSLPFRCYNKIFNFWFRDENLVDPVIENTGAGPDDIADYKILSRRKRRDYITSGLPFPQKGPDVTVNLGGLAPVQGIGILGNFASSDNTLEYWQTDNPEAPIKPGPSSMTPSGIVGTGVQAIGIATQNSGTPNTDTGLPAIYADLASASGISINDLRESVQIQRLLERDARGGTRYPEILRSHFQVSDPGLLVHQRPLFLGGGSTQINVNPVAQTNSSASDVQQQETPQGNLAAYATVSANGHGFTSSFTEHGHILGLVNVRADLTYQQGLERYWSRQTRFDFYWPALSHLGEQQVRNSEVFVSNDSAIDDDTFAYMPRYDEYRFKQSQITGLFRSTATASLDVWHLAQDFATLPALNAAFITDDVPMDRVLAVPSEPDFLLDVYFRIKAARPLPLYGTPGLMDHF